MLSKVETKQKAIELRRTGLSYKEIMDVLHVPKSSLSNWISRIELTTEQQQRLEKNISKGRDFSRFKAGQTNSRKRIDRENRVVVEANKGFETNKHDSFFLMGICLYWAEGGKKTRYFQFVNSDSEMIALMIKWVGKFLDIQKENIKYRLYIHEPYAHEKCEEYWASKIRVSPSIFQKTIYKPTPHKVKKNPNYKGCFAMTITKVDLFYTLMTWQKLLIAYYEGIQI
jgi:hypothetical protein